MLRAGWDLSQWAPLRGLSERTVAPALALGCLSCGAEAPLVQVERQADGSYRAILDGHFTLQVSGEQPFRWRLLLLFLGLLDGPARGSRRTREGRTPLVTQQELAAWFELPQPVVSRLTGYWLAGDWANLLSLKTPEVLTADLVGRIVEVWATFPWWSAEEVGQHLQAQGVAVTLSQVQQAAEHSGWRRLREVLWERYDLRGPTLQLREGWLVAQLLGQVQDLVARLEAGQGAPPEQRLLLSDLQSLAAAAAAAPPPPVKTLPWLLRVEQVLFGHWHTVTDGQVHCPRCGTPDVKRKGNKPRLKQYYNESGQLQEVAVQRYFCNNSRCAVRTFSDLPAGLVPYSRYRAEVHLLALQLYAWGHSSYRRTGAALHIASLTAWRWVSAWGHALLPVAALFGVVKSSGIVGVDEKYVLVPKNDKPAGDMRRWMYVYFAVDVWTYDLLHIAVYPYLNQASARAFLVALRAKGYHPTTIVTDLREDYGALIAQVFPQASHHECLFHALTDVQPHVQDVYGPHYADEHPEAETLKRQIYAIFDQPTPALATERYTQVLALRTAYVTACPQAAVIFDFLARHWPQLVNSIGSDLIPATNNAVELVIRRFDQHYQNFCGFQSIQTTQLYLAVFEKLYRCTPFSPDAQPRVRGKCPLQLAGYDISQLPMMTICSGFSVLWPTETAHVPKS